MCVCVSVCVCVCDHCDDLVIHNIHVGPGSQATIITTDNNTTLQPTNCMHQDACSRPGKINRKPPILTVL